MTLSTKITKRKKLQLKLEDKIIYGLERLSDVFKSLIWRQAKRHQISPIQIQILLFVSSHDIVLSNVTHLSKEFNVTKPTISDAVKSLYNKGFLEKEYSNSDSRSYSLMLTPEGKTLVSEISTYNKPVKNVLSGFPKEQQEVFFGMMTQLIFDMKKADVIQVQRTCFGCRFYSKQSNIQHCSLLEKELQTRDIRLDCAEFEPV